MRKITLFLFSLFALLASVTTANAQETKSPYKVDFNSAIATDDHSFLVDVGWDHLVGSVDKDYYGGQRYVEYTYSSTDGKDGSGCLQVGTQKLRDVYGDYSYVNDYLITPAISGSSSILVKKAAKYTSSGEGFLVVYKMKKANGKYVVDGSPIYSSNDEQIESDDWTKIDLPEVNGVRLGIYASYVSLDDFEAESAKIELKKEMSITSSSSIGTYTDANADGNYTFDFNVTVKNTGGATLNPGDAGYQVDIKNAVGKIVKTIAIDKALEAGESYTIPVSVTLNISDYPDASYYYAYEGISETKTTIAKVTPVAYAPVLKVTNGGKEVGDDYVLNFGNVKTAKTEVFTVTNNGGKSLNVSKIEVTNGFLTDVIAPISVAPHESAQIKVTMDVAAVGAKNGTLVLETDGGNKTITLKGVVLDATSWIEDFEDGKLPAGMMIIGNDKVWSISDRAYSLKTDDNKKAAVANNSSLKAILVSPLLEISEGESLAFDAARQYSKGNLEVMYSPDRQKWTTVKTMNTEDFSSEKVSYDYKYSLVTIDGIPAGKYYIGFSSNGCYIDNIAGFKLADVAHDWSLSKTDVPASGEVNSVLKVTATLQNLNVKDEKDGGYTAELYVDGQPIASANSVTIAGGESANFTFSFVPHTAGTISVYVKFSAGDYKVESSPVAVAIAEEQASSDYKIGEVKSVLDKNGPFTMYDKKSEMEILYPVSKLTDLSKGAKITKVIFRGTMSQDVTSDMAVYMDNTTDESLPNPYTVHPIESMTKVYEGSYEFKALANTGDLFVLNLTEPFVYEGSGIRFFVSSTSPNWRTAKFEIVADDEKLAYMRSSDGDITTKSFGSKPLPVVHFVVTNEPATVTGTITDSETNKAVVNANVKFVSGDIEYSGTTDENGQYSIEVIKTGLTYKAEVTAEGYKTLGDAAVDLAAVNNFKLESATPTGISEISESESANSAIVYNAQGILVSKNGLVGLKPGLYIVNGKKIIKK